MTFTCHSLGFIELGGIKSLFFNPSGEPVTKSVMAVAVELFDTLAVIFAFQDVLKGTPIQAPSKGVGLTNTG